MSVSALMFAACNCGSTPPIGTEEDGGEGGSAGGGTGGGISDQDAGGEQDGGDTDGGLDDAGTGGGSGDGGSGSDGGSCTAPVSCYSGATGTLGIGACRAGTQACIGGSPGPCTGEVLPAAESCNGADDDCDGTADELQDLGSLSCGVGECAVTVNACTNGSPTSCAAGAPVAEVCGDNKDNDCDGTPDDGCPCGFYVAPNGNDANAGSTAAPLRTIAAAITRADAATGNKTVCVASGANAPSTFDYAEAVVMKNGVTVLGGYVTTPASWSRPGLAGGAVTRITAQNAKGVLFDQTITSTTAIDGFQLLGISAVAVSAAVTVEGSTGAQISNNLITGGSATTAYGVNVVDSGGVTATPRLLRNAITGGSGVQLSVGIRSVNSAPVVTSHCTAVDAAGRCSAFGCGAGTGLFIRGKQFGANGLDSYAVMLENSPGALLSQNAICAAPASTNPAGTSVGVYVRGNAAGTQIRTSNISSNNAGKDSVAIWLEGCGGASPWIFDNFRIGGSSGVAGSRGDGIRVIGDCHPRIDSNLLIVGGEEGSNAPANGVLCDRDVDAGVSSRCTVLGNTQIRGSSAGYPPVAVGVRCNAGACARIEDNALISGWQGITAVGLVLSGSAVFVNNNRIEAGCANGAAGFGAGVVSNDSTARLQNNVIAGFSASSLCPGNALSSFGVRVTAGAQQNELDLHSNDVFALGRNVAACRSRAVGFEPSDAGTSSGPRGILRNNILHAGACGTSVGIEELSALADPRIVENNDFIGAPNSDGGFGTALYVDEGSTLLTTLSAVNALTDVTAANNLSVDPQFVSANNLHLQPTSPARNAGTDAGCPATDVDGDSRPQENVCDIGADEYRP